MLVSQAIPLPPQHFNSPVWPIIFASADQSEIMKLNHDSSKVNEQLHNSYTSSFLLLPLMLGDPSIFGNLPPHPAVIEGVKLALESGQYNGYGHSSGIPHVREVVAKEFSRPGATFTKEV